ncbi:pseudouridine synthase [Pusillimonas sp. MFBS29]|uniref:pseudouridine synthase n=1 Tax=Pusillimonas sp. MFBS29 TaxID=2886690 RepID=UPI001D1291F4|nr:pseudouridine synthase [Pusillimonas sp. MFBS29]MCC2595797.1 pseudouridine synthase [Pusillimonas sp. MFBS29]
MKQSRRLEFVRGAPLPTRDGVAPSRVYLPPGPWSLLREFLFERFPHIPRDVLLERLARGDIVDEAGVAQTSESKYQALGWLWYYREVPEEVRLPSGLPVLFRDDYLVVVDKPHFLASIPGGRYLKETALVRLRQSLNLPELSPIHRLDRDTAGVLVFCAHPASRGAYQTLFQTRAVHKEYEALAGVRADLAFPLVHRSRMEQRTGHFTMLEVPGEPNSETRIELIEADNEVGRYRLHPHTGRKHQLRVHMSALGLPIQNDGFYPVLLPYAQDDDFSRPLQLLARSIEFTDPVSGQPRRFESQRSLSACRPDA